jgi:two-component system sensor kinase
MLRDTTERVRAEAALRRSQEELQHLSASVLATREEERYRIARELHDDLGQRLSALKMDLTLLATDLDATGTSAELLERTAAMQRVIDDTVAAVPPTCARPCWMSWAWYPPSSGSPKISGGASG